MTETLSPNADALATEDALTVEDPAEEVSPEEADPIITGQIAVDGEADDDNAARQAAGASGTSEDDGEGGKIGKPDAGETVVIELTPGEEVEFGFSLDDVEIAISDIDIIVQFPDGAKIVLPGMAVEIASNSIDTISFSDGVFQSQDVLAQVGRFVASDTPVDLIFSSSAPVEDATGAGPAELDTTEAEATGGAEAESEPTDVVAEQTVETPQAVEVSENDAEFETTAIDDTISPPPDPFDGVGPSDAPPAPVVEENPATSVNDFEVPVPEISVRLLGVAGQETATLSDGRNEIRGATAIEAAETDDSFAVQYTPETIAGTGTADVIYADDPRLAPEGTSVRLLEIDAVMPDAAWAVTGATISGLPAGFAVVDAQQNVDGYVVAPEADNPNKLFVPLRYALPDSDTVPDDNDFLGEFTVTINYDVSNSTINADAQTSATARFAIRNVTSEEDTQFTDGNGDPVYIVSAPPVGNIIDAGGGDDLVFAGAGFDTIDGGSGNDRLSFAQSSEGVTADLSTGSGSG
ncbi:MAG: hypothetical protein AAGA88_09165, partial [Pseudomonadota bacterium]